MPSPAAGSGALPAASARLPVLKKRASFLAAARARRVPTAGFLLQARERPLQEAPVAGTAGIRVGFTCSKKLGNAVTRNRAKRRLRALARELLPELGRPGWDYVLIGKPGATVARPFELLKSDLRAAMGRIHG